MSPVDLVFDAILDPVLDTVLDPVFSGNKVGGKITVEIVTDPWLELRCPARPPALELLD
jgi:hypothetical protein